MSNQRKKEAKTMWDAKGWYWLAEKNTHHLQTGKSSPGQKIIVYR